MICQTCAAAADNRLVRDMHCDSEGGPGAACDCQHRVDRYRPAASALFAPISISGDALRRLEGQFEPEPTP